MRRQATLVRRSAAVGLACLLSWIGLPGHSTGANAAELWEQVSGKKALEHVQYLVDLGPRPPGSEAIEKSRVYIEKQLQSWGWKVTRQSFTDDTPRGKMTFINLIATYQGGGTPQFLLCSHYDSKFFDTIRFVGANDSGSSTGLLLEVGRVLSQDPALAARLELVFFDGEEAYENFTETDGLYGSRYFARQLGGDKTKFRGGILFDMVGDRSLDITLPPDSPSQMARQIFVAADALKLRDHFTYFDRQILDDHTPLNAAGVPTIDLIDFHFPWWHTDADTMDKISAESLQTVGRVALYYLSKNALK
jgi:glutaminyl-peptide cyclotransferase